ncbi:helix-turn-helix domain-containing protein [Sphingomonas sp. IC-56]|uniref:helix-turn-helix domain-containing protein n=1 Tax=Sphingomonas sp. IC-56 TaxID=2898529 RepID=UPI001E2C511C|nr:helix-turn-helix domain-containing protein [Sphingomonas sp. IC-56]MCD2324979.1 helix-turn-helix domain-containing protein [Sphingomonas sp. IC-56]
MQPVLHPINRFCEIYGIGRTKTYEMINAKELETVKVGRKRLITEASARRALLGEAA